MRNTLEDSRFTLANDDYVVAEAAVGNNSLTVVRISVALYRLYIEF
ncbi:hypothetical protein JHL21_03375 [Devosia sp. WQ 349]|nr:hypothetical protein [Devosia sp. WQ 349K1]MBK1793532.1 hypothetical protein [Devosia sp. WQ 349K1]